MGLPLINLLNYILEKASSSDYGRAGIVFLLGTLFLSIAPIQGMELRLPKNKKFPPYGNYAID